MNLVKFVLMMRFLTCMLMLACCGCSNQVDIFCDYKETAVIYGLLDQSDTVIRVRIGKTFQPVNGATAGAAVSDNLYFGSLTVRLVRNDGFEVSLLRNSSIQKEAGFFANDRNGVYEGPANFSVRKGETWTLEVTNNENGNRYSGSTEVINGLIFPTSFVPNAVFEGDNIFEFQPSAESFVCDMSVMVHYRVREVADTNQFTDKVLFYPVSQGIMIDKPLQSPSIFTQFKGMDLIYAFRQAEPFNPSRQIRITSVDYLFTAGDKSVRDYVSMFKPSSDFGSRSRQYSNITNGIGLFSSRHTRRFANVPLSPGMVSTFQHRIPEFIP